jgi:hypothetical protein
MKFEIGDQVVVKHSHEDGKVVEIINDKMVLVEVRGVRFPAYTDQLDFPYFKQFSSQPLVTPKKPARKYIDDLKPEKNPPRYQVEEGVWLLLFPVFSKDVFDDDVVEALKLYLVNQTKLSLRFQFWLNLRGEREIELQNEVPALQDFYLMNLPFEDLNDAPSFEFEFSLKQADKRKVDYFEAMYKPKAKQVFKQISQLLQEGKAFFAHRLFERYPEKEQESLPPLQTDPFASLAKAGYRVVAGRKLPTTTPPPPSVLDLHIEKLTDDYRQMNALEKLTLQLKTFEKWLDEVEQHHQKQVWVIHGIGSGKLRDELHELLKHRDTVARFVNQYHPWFGHGATEILLK